MALALGGLIYAGTSPCNQPSTQDQVDKFEHVIFAGFTHEPAE